MSHFYGTLQGSRGEATRCRTKRSGVETIAASWDGCIKTIVCYNEETGNNEFVVLQKPWQGRGEDKILAKGVF